MNLLEYVDSLQAGGTGSGCNPAVGRCGRKPGGKGGHARSLVLPWKRYNDPNGVQNKFTAHVKGADGADHRIVLRREDHPAEPGKFRWSAEVDGQIVNTKSGADAKYFKNALAARNFMENSLDKYIGSIVRPLAPAAPGAAQVREPVAPKDRTEKETYLSEASIIGSKLMGGEGGINTSYKVTLEDGSHALWKPKSGEDRGLVRSMGRSLWRGEVMAYDVGKIVGADVPETVARTEKGEKGSIQNWSEEGVRADTAGWGWGQKPEGKFSWDKMDQDNMRSGAAFDWVSGNPDRHYGNFLIYDKEGKKAVKLIDHGQVFNRSSSAPGRNSQLVKYMMHVNETIPQSLKSTWTDKWPDVEKAARKMGATDKDILETKKRLEIFQKATRWKDLAPGHPLGWD